jgi:hypothetical protein
MPLSTPCLNTRSHASTNASSSSCDSAVPVLQARVKLRWSGRLLLAVEQLNGIQVPKAAPRVTVPEGGTQLVLPAREPWTRPHHKLRLSTRSPVRQVRLRLRWFALRATEQTSHVRQVSPTTVVRRQNWNDRNQPVAAGRAARRTRRLKTSGLALKPGILVISKKLRLVSIITVAADLFVPPQTRELPPVEFVTK